MGGRWAWVVLLMVVLLPLEVRAQDDVTADTVMVKGAEGRVPLARARREGMVRVVADSLVVDTTGMNETVQMVLDSLGKDGQVLEDVVVDGADTTVVGRFQFDTDSLRKIGERSKLKERFVPNPKKALWLAIVIPGGGQIYNRKYWKLPLIYGGFLGCLYAITWNNTMYRDYSQAFIDITDSDPNTKSYMNFISPHYDVESNVTRLQDVFKRKKDYYRRFRDLSVFIMIGVYALSIVDAYVDAELSSFDISKDLTLKVHPTIMHDRYSAMQTRGLRGNSYGLECSLNF